MTGTVCPCCRAVSVRPFIVDLNTNVIACGDRQVRVSPQTAEVAEAISAAWPAAASTTTIIRQVWGWRQYDLQVDGVLKVTIHNLRTALRPIGIEVETVRAPKGSDARSSYRFVLPAVAEAA